MLSSATTADQVEDGYWSKKCNHKKAQFAMFSLKQVDVLRDVKVE